jgi:hypothetical protein
MQRYKSNLLGLAEKAELSLSHWNEGETVGLVTVK